MLLDIRCKTGKIQLTDDGTLHIAQFSKILWQAPASAVTGLVAQPGSVGTLTVTIITTQGHYLAELVSKDNFEKLRNAFPQAESQVVGNAWYESPTALTHVVTYTKEKDMQRDLEAAYQHGWQIEGQSATGSHVNVGRAVSKFVLTGGIGLMTGVSRSKDKTTITFVRTPEWLDQHRPAR